MADITMCTNDLCPNAGNCYRVQAKASDWQSWTGFQYTVGPQGVICEHYMPVYKTEASDRTST